MTQSGAVEAGTLKDRRTLYGALVQSVYVSDIYVANGAFFNILFNVLGHKGGGDSLVESPSCEKEMAEE